MKNPSKFFLTVFMVLICAKISAQSDEEITIMITNDDGYEHDNLMKLARCASELGKVYVIAPFQNMSGASNQLTESKKAVEIREHKSENNITIISVDGTPSTVVRWGVRHLDSIHGKKPNLVLSGINSGPNVGISVFYSGTIGAAREGALLGVPSLALSIVNTNPDFDGACRVIKRMAKKIFQNAYQTKLFNINFPGGTIHDSTVIKQTIVDMNGAKLIYRPFQHPTSKRTYFFPTLRLIRKEKDPSDIYAITNGKISVTPLLLDMTSKELLDLN